VRADWLFIADAHLREWDRESQERIIRFLEQEGENLDTLVILGDFFEFWFGFDTFAFEGYRPILDKLEALVNRGIHIRYTEGNHDFGLGGYFRDTLKAHIDVDESLIHLGGKTVYVAHGDLVDRKDRFYRIFRRVLRSAPTYWIMRHVGPKLTKKAASFLGRVSRGKRGHRSRERVNDVFEQFAMERLREGYDVVILAHSHVPQSRSFSINGKEAYYFNVGDWIHHFSFLRYQPGQGFRMECFQN